MTLLDDATTTISRPATADTALVEFSAPANDHGTDVAGHTAQSAVSRRRRASILSRQNPESIKLLGHLQSMARGDHAALAKCYDQMGTVVFSLAIRMLRDLTE